MDKDQNFNFRTKLKNILPLHGIYNKLKNIYFTIIPKGSKTYQFTYGFLKILLKRIHLFNIYYQEWIQNNDTKNDEKYKKITEKIKGLEYQPHISIVMPVYNPPIKLLESAIQSVIDQVYPYWELCIADDASTNPDVKILLKTFSEQDERIKTVFREENGHISAASNSALSLVSCDFTALLDHDDVLHPLSLYYTAQCILENPNCEIIYTDEDKITKKNRRLDAYFKPDFNYHLLLSQNMVSHLGVYRTETIRKIGGFRIGLEGSQDYDLLLRAYEEINSDQIHHIPFPLYHWRISRESAAEDVNVKPYAIEAGKQALMDHLKRQSIMGQVKFLPDVAGYQINYDLPLPKPDVAILIKAQDFTKSLENCVHSILENTDYPNYTIVICLPQKTQGSAKQTSFLSQQKVGIEFFPDSILQSFAETMNQAVSRLSADFLLFLDQSTNIASHGWLKNLIGQGSQEKIGAVGPKLLYKNNYIYSAGIVLLPGGEIQQIFNSREISDDGYFGWARLTRSYSALSEKCLLIKRKIFNSVGGLTTDLKTSVYANIDLCLKLKSQGLYNVFRPSVELYLQDNYRYNNPPEFTDREIEEDKLYMLNHWQKWMLKDPGFNPNLTFVDDGKLLVDLSPEYDLPGA